PMTRPASNNPLPTRRFALAGIAAALTSLAGRAPSLAAMRSLQVGYFPGVGTLPLWAGIELGIFERAGLGVTAKPTPASSELFAAIDRGDLDLAHTSIDNPIAYDAGVGAAALTHRDFVAFAGVDDGMLRLVARPGISTIAELRGKTLAVDAMSTGYAFALRELLAKAGLTDADVTYVAKGGTQQRAEQLMAGAVDATLVTPPFDVQANAKGFRTLARATDVLGSYQGIALVTRRAWLQANRPVAITYVRAFRAALERVATDRATAVGILMRNTKVDEPTANASYDAAFGPQGGVHRDAALDLAGIKTVLQLRAKYAPPGAGSAPELYVDTTILRDASG
ncbi:MAG TPA: ABC transporter substrate-binding protein, partial [Candidatus Acidoferrum sp.]|nr:ABC transporter substrate-binding protein [Candidatus Acidoferrum sp.]